MRKHITAARRRNWIRQAILRREHLRELDMEESKQKLGGDDCHLCGGSGEVAFVPFGAPDCEQDVFGCPGCIQAERDQLQAERDQLAEWLANLERLTGVYIPRGQELSRKDHPELFKALQEQLPDLNGQFVKGDQ
jgi:hypothetical protein